MDRMIVKKEKSISLVILGASGFVGKGILRECSFFSPIKAVARKIPSDKHLFSSDVTWYSADLLIPDSLSDILQEGDIVINLVYIRSENDSDNIHMIDNIIEACLRHRVSRLIHCSTAMVVGGVQQLRVDESIICSPVSKYEQIKYAMEQRLQHAGLDVVIMRPTAIVGQNGLNLRKLAHALYDGSHIVNYLRACLFGKRKMHLVPLRNVAIALLHLANINNKFDRDVYFLAADDDPENNYLTVEKILRQSLGLRPRRVPILPLPLFILSTLLRFMGCSEWNLKRTYDARKIIATNLILPDSINKAIRDFGASVKKTRN